MAKKNSREAEIQARRLLGTGCATRVGSVVAIFFSALGDYEDSFPAIQAYESCWRELSGHPGSAELHREILGDLRTLQDRASASELPGARAVWHSLRAAEALVREWDSESTSFSSVAAASLDMAAEFDRAGEPAPGGHNTWVSYERSGQAVLKSEIYKDPGLVQPGDIFVIRTSAGSGSMGYREAISKMLGF